MKTKIVKIDCLNESTLPIIKEASEIIKNGGLVVFPTETVYGLGADGTSSPSAEKIYSAKGRPSDNPLIIHISKPEDAEVYTYTNEIYYDLARAFMPGPLTVVLRAKDTVPLKTRGGLDTVAVRCPENPIANKLIELSGVPIAAPSANISGSPSPTNPIHVIEDMQGRVDMIIDGGECEFGLESTIVKIDDNNALTLLRPGKITVDDLLCVADEVKIADAVTGALREGEKVLSPGMKYKHYAPKTEVILLEGEIDKIVRYLKENSTKNTAVIMYSEYCPLLSESLSDAVLYDFGSVYDKCEQAHRLFNILREADKKNHNAIYAPLPDKCGIGLALYNRMIRAAGYKIIRM